MSTENMQFLIYAIETYKSSKDIEGEECYALLKNSGALDFIIEFYDILHSTSDKDIVWQIDDFIKHHSQFYYIHFKIFFGNMNYCI